MKLKQSILLMIPCLLIGCSSPETEKVTVCEDHSPYRVYSSQLQTLTSLNREVLRIEKEVVIEFDSQTERDALIEILDSTYQTLSSIEGLSMRYEVIDDTSIRDVGTFDLEKLSSSTLADLGILKEDSNELEIIVNRLEDAGYTCREES